MKATGRYLIIILLFAILIGWFIYVSVVTVDPVQKVEILSIEIRDHAFKKQYQYRVLLPDSTVGTYWSNDIYYVGDKIKI